MSKVIDFGIAPSMRQLVVPGEHGLHLPSKWPWLLKSPEVPGGHRSEAKCPIVAEP